MAAIVKALMTKIVFCFPYRGVGGVSSVFALVARELIERREHEIYIADYRDGAMTKMLAAADVRMIEYRDDAPVALPSGAIVAFQSFPPWRWRYLSSLRFATGTRIFFWNFHPFNLVPVLPGLRSLVMANESFGVALGATLLRGYRQTLVRLVRFMLERNALVFMDRPCHDTTERYLRMSIPDAQYLPLSAGHPGPTRCRPAPDWSRGLRVAWVGRLADFKYPILRATLARLDAIQPRLGVPVTFSVVGDGGYMDRLREFARTLRRIDVRFVGSLAPDAVAEFLDAEADLVMAMGVSALEGARLGIPTVLLDFSYRPVPEGYVYRWLHDQVGYSLGEPISPARLVRGNDSLYRLISEAIDDFADVSTRAQDYFATAHSVRAVASRFLTLVERSSCFYSDYEAAGFAVQDPIYKTFSLMRARFASQ